MLFSMVHHDYGIFHRFPPFGGCTKERWSALPHEFRTLQLGEVGHRTGFRAEGPVVMFSKPDSHPDLYQGFMKRLIYPDIQNPDI